MLKVAVPNKGTLSEPAAEMLREAGYRQRHESRDLTVLDLANDVEFFFLRPKDIAVYVGLRRARPRASPAVTSPPTPVRRSTS